MFGAVLKISLSTSFRKSKYSRGNLILSGASGLMTSLLGIGLAFFPGQQIISLRAYEAWMIGGTLSFICVVDFCSLSMASGKAPRRRLLLYRMNGGFDSGALYRSWKFTSSRRGMGRANDNGAPDLIDRV